MARARGGLIQKVIILCVFIFILNFIYFITRRIMTRMPVKAQYLRGFDLPLSPYYITKPKREDQKRFKNTIKTHLIVVAGHAVVKINALQEAIRQDSSWYLLNYQLNQDFPMIIASHIRKGLSLAADDSNATLIFSGGQTRRDVGPLSEAASYYYVAVENKWINTRLQDRIYLEEFARDSFENLLFSICRFKEVNGVYPTKISVVGFDFKAKRFTQFHRQALRFPMESFTYYGLRPHGVNFDHDKAVSGESEVISMFQEDQYACHTDSLRIKREKRNPFHRTIPYIMSCPEIRDLLKWCGPDVYSGPLPWSLSSSV